MALRPSFQHGTDADFGPRPYVLAGRRPQPIASAFRAIARLVLAIPMFVVTVVLGIATFVLGIGVGAVFGFMYFADAWHL